MKKRFMSFRKARITNDGIELAETIILDMFKIIKVELNEGYQTIFYETGTTFTYVNIVTDGSYLESLLTKTMKFE